MRDIVELTEDWLEHMPSGDFDGFSGEVAPDFVLHLPFVPPGVPTQFSGRDAAQAALSQAAMARSPLVFTDKTILRTQDPELVVVTANAEATMTNGTPYRNSYVIFVRIRGETVIEHTEYLNPLAIMEAMGSAPES